MPRVAKKKKRDDNQNGNNGSAVKKKKLLEKPAKRKRKTKKPPTTHECNRCHHLFNYLLFSKRYCETCTQVLRKEQCQELKETWNNLMGPQTCVTCNVKKDLQSFALFQFGSHCVDVKYWDPDVFDDKVKSKIVEDFPKKILTIQQKQATIQDQQRHPKCYQCETMDQWNETMKVAIPWQNRFGGKRAYYDFPDNPFFTGAPSNFTLEQDNLGYDVLLGKYQVIYHHGEDMNGPGESTTVHNSYITLTKKREEDEAETFRLTATFDKTVTDRCYVFDSNFEMSTTPNDECWENTRDPSGVDHVGWKMEFGKLKYHDQDRCRFTSDQLEDIEEHSEGRILVVKNRVAMPWLPWEMIEREECDDDNEGTAADRRTEQRRILDAHHPRHYTTAKEAETYMCEYNKRRHDKNWMCQHLNFPPLVAKMVHDFTASSHKPEPVFFIEPGDLILHIKYGYEHWLDHQDRDGYLYSKYILRKVD